MNRKIRHVASATVYVVMAWTSSPSMSTEGTDQPAPGAIAFLRAHDARVQAVLEQSGDSLSAETRQEVRGKIDAAFDFEELSRLSLGDHWERRSAKERTEFVSVFSCIISEKNFDSFVDADTVRRDAIGFVTLFADYWIKWNAFVYEQLAARDGDDASSVCEAVAAANLLGGS